MSVRRAAPSQASRRSRAKRAALREIERQIATCRQCKRRAVGKPVPGEGNPDAAVVFIGVLNIRVAELG